MAGSGPRRWRWFRAPDSVGTTSVRYGGVEIDQADHCMYLEHDHPGQIEGFVRKPVNIADAKARLPELVERASRGEEIVIARNGKPQARLVPLARRVRRVAGRGAGEWRVVGDFNAPLPDELLKAFEGRDK